MQGVSNTGNTTSNIRMDAVAFWCLFFFLFVDRMMCWRRAQLPQRDRVSTSSFVCEHESDEVGFFMGYRSASLHFTDTTGVPFPNLNTALQRSGSFLFRVLAIKSSDHYRNA